MAVGYRFGIICSMVCLSLFCSLVGLSVSQILLLKTLVFLVEFKITFHTFLDHLSTKCSRWVIVIAFCPSSVNFFSSVTSGSIELKLHRKHPLNGLMGIPSKFWDSCRILVSMATKRKKLKNSPSPKLVGRFSNNFVEMFLGWPSIRFLQAMLIGQKTWPPGVAGLFCLIWL